MEDFDKLELIVKNSHMEEIVTFYNEFGWAQVESRPHHRYGDLSEITLRRPHKIAHKDKLQLLQVRLERAIDDSQRLIAYPLFSSLNACAVLGIMCLLAVAFSIYALFALSALWSILLVTGTLGAIAFSGIWIWVFSKSIKERPQKAKAIRQRIESIIEEVRSLRGTYEG